MPPERSESFDEEPPEKQLRPHRLWNEKWTLKQRPEGLFDPDADVALVREPIDLDDDGCCGDDQIVVETSHLSVDAFLRTMMDADAYHGSVALGGTVPALGYGRILRAGSGTKLKAGSYVAGMMGAQTHPTLKAAEVFPMVNLPWMPRTASLGLMGATTGLTAYAGVFYVCPRPRKGETVVVTAAAGAVGSVAAQLARTTGARVVGVAGGKAKGAYLVEELGLDAAVDYKDEERTIEEQLNECCPDGIDFIYDNVGGDTLNALLGKINKGGRVVICGAISQYGKARGTATGPSNYIKLAEQGATMKGFNFMMYVHRLPFMLFGMFFLYMRGMVKMTEQVDVGIGSFPMALRKLFTGGNTGKLLVKVKCDSDSGVKTSKKDD